MGTTTQTKQQVPHRTVRILLPARRWLALALLGLAGSAAAWLYWRSHACLPQLDGTVRLSALVNPVEVLRDARGVPHLRAQSLEDLLFAQGYVTAQDRLWQMDISRRLSEGELSEVFSESTLRLDIENRTLGFRQAMARAIDELDAESRNLLRAYARGVNTFISTHRGRLPIEFLILRYKPRPWQEIDSFAIATNLVKSLNTSWPDELMRERIRSRLAPDLYADLFPDHSPLDEPVASTLVAAVRTPPLQPDRESLLGWSLKNSLIKGSHSERPGSTASPHGGPFIDSEPTRNPTDGSSWLPSPWDSTSATGLGSNNWVLSGSRTKSGKPLLANDPHLGHSVPSVWYMIHLKAPGLNVSGVSLPGLPLVIIGHNERIAWGMTNTSPDVQDLYVESFNLRDPRKYLHNGEWIEDEEREETIKVRNKRDYRFTVKVTRHGPVVSHERNRELALRATALEPHALRLPFLGIDRAQNWQEFTFALHDFTAPMQNFVYADVEGNIGYYAAGWVPIRKQGDGSVPSPGDTDDYDWAGYIPFEDLPHVYNPPSGRLATANGRVVPDSYPYLITHKWEAPYRTARIFELLRYGRVFTVADMFRIQTDIVSLEDEWLKGELLAAAAARPPEGAEGLDAQYALGLVRDWNGEARADSAATLVLEVTRRALLERIARPKLGDDLSGYNWPMATTFLENVLRNRWPRWLPPGDPDFNLTLVRSLEEGMRRIPEVIGSADRRVWKWGDTIPLIFRHRLSGSSPFLGLLLDTGPYPQSGTKTTVKQTTPSIGPSMRMVIDFSNFDGSVQNITLGESGQVSSPYYRDQFQDWYTGRSFPMLFSDAAVEKGAVHRLVLEPAR